MHMHKSQSRLGNLRDLRDTFSCVRITVYGSVHIGRKGLANKISKGRQLT